MIKNIKMKWTNINKYNKTNIKNEQNLYINTNFFLQLRWRARNQFDTAVWNWSLITGEPATLLSTLSQLAISPGWCENLSVAPRGEGGETAPTLNPEISPESWNIFETEADNDTKLKSYLPLTIIHVLTKNKRSWEEKRSRKRRQRDGIFHRFWIKIRV